MIKVIPAIDILNSQCVRLIQGDYSSGITYYRDPLEMASMLRDQGFTRIHMVDLDGARAAHIVNYRILEKVAALKGLVVDFGGGVKSDEDLKIAFESGASMVTGGSVAARNPVLFLEWLEAYGPERIILGADFKEGKIAVAGWLEDTGKDLFEFVGYFAGKGILQTICTDVSKDGMMAGTAVETYVRLLKENPGLGLVASGGVGSVRDLEILEENSVPGVIVGRALYEGRITLKELRRFIL